MPKPDIRDVFLCHAWDERQGAAKDLHDLLESRGASVEEMSGVLGSAVGAVADDRGGQTKCTYEVAGGELGGAYAEVQLNWGDGEAGMAGAGAMEPELGKVMGEFAGLGDQATAVGPMILIRRGDDLITLVISGVRDSTAAAKAIYKLLDARLGKPAP